MAATNVRGGQITDATISRADLNTNGTAGTCVIAKVVQGTGISLSASGTDAGTGDVTITKVPQAVPKVTVLTASSGTFTCTAGVRALLVECIGGGGGGGGALGSATTCMSAGGGGGGAYARKLVTSPAASYTYIVGAGGSAGATTPGAGGIGGATSFGATSVCTASGGNGGGTGNATATGPIQSSTGGAGSLAGFIGDVGYRGSDGLGGLRWSGTSGASGEGGAASCGGGAVEGLAAQGAGTTGYQYGGGGSGALSTSTTGFAGGAGFQGVIIVTEYF